MRRAKRIPKEHPRLGEGIFTSSDISEILGIEKRRVAYLLKAYTEKKFKDLSKFNYVFKNDNRKGINFYGLIELKVFHTLRENGFSSHKILEAYKAYSKEFNTNYPFAKKQVLFLGNRIIIDLGGDNYIKTTGERSLIIPEIIRSFAEKIEFSDNNMALRYFPLGKDKNVVVDPNHQFGSPVIKGTNIKAHTIVNMYDSGDSIKMLSNLYNLEENSIQDAIKYCHRKAS